MAEGTVEQLRGRIDRLEEENERLERRHERERKRREEAETIAEEATRDRYQAQLALEQAATMIEDRARALEERLAQQTSLQEYGRYALERREVDHLMAELCERMGEVLGPDCCALFELEADRRGLLLREGRGLDEQAVGRARIDAAGDSFLAAAVDEWDPVRVDDHRSDERFRRPDVLAGEDIRSGVAVAVPGPQRPWGVLSVHDRQPGAFDQHDVTFVQTMARILGHAIERERARREIEQAHQRYRTLVDNFPNGLVALVDEDLRILEIGGTRALEVEHPDRVRGERVPEILSEEFAAEIVPAYRAALEGQAQTFRHGSGGRFFQFRVVPVRDKSGEVFAALGLSQDVTELKRREEELEASNRRLEHFAYAASHDLQEPLRTVTSYLQLVDERYGDRLDDQGREFIQHAVDGAQRMSRMIDSLLTYARVTTQGGELERVDAQAVLDDALSDLRLEIEETDAEVGIGRLPTVVADPDQLAQVFRNLVANALKYSGDEPPVVHVEAEPEGRYWRFSVEDEGVGIAPAEQDSVFEVFKRVEDHEHEQHGTGIGLAICRQIVDRHGGEMWVDSELGEGSTFHFTMLRAD